MFTYKIKTFDNKEKEILLYTREYDSIRNAADALDVSPATLSNHMTGKRFTKVLKRYEIEKSETVVSPFIRYFNDIMKLKTDDARFKYMAERIKENLIQSV
jgi:hypothetical protein